MSSAPSQDSALGNATSCSPRPEPGAPSPALYGVSTCRCSAAPSTAPRLKALRPELASAPQLVLIEVVRAHRMAGLAGRQHDARVVPRADVEHLPPRRMLPGAEPRQAAVADPHHRGAVAVDRHRAAIEEPRSRQPAVAERMREAGGVHAIPAALRSTTTRPASAAASSAASRKMSSRGLALLHRGDVVPPARVGIAEQSRRARPAVRRRPTRRTRRNRRRRPTRRRRCAATARLRRPGTSVTASVASTTRSQLVQLFEQRHGRASAPVPPGPPRPARRRGPASTWSGGGALPIVLQRGAAADVERSGVPRQHVAHPGGAERRGPVARDERRSPPRATGLFEVARKPRAD